MNRHYLLEQIERDKALVAALSPEVRKAMENELRAIYTNPGITFPNSPVPREYRR